MTRRDFVSATLAAGTALLAGRESLLAAPQGSTTAGASRSPQYFELRRYHLLRGPMTQLLDGYVRDALMPAVQRAGGGPVGAFNVMIGPESPTLHVLLVHPTIDAFATLPGRLLADAEYAKAGAAYLNAVATSPAFVRIDSSLLRAFPSMPAVELPFGGGEAGRRARIFELRTYESHSEAAGRKKIEMFETGEIALFRKAGMSPVFFAQTMVGPKMPNLTYMLVYEDMAARDRQWAAFAADPAWRTLSSTPGFTDPEIVSNITNSYLRPTVYSQI